MTKLTAEQRRDTRVELACPVSIYNRAGELVVRSRTVNVSDGGLLVTVPVETLGKLDAKANVAFSVPRCTPNTHMLEDFACPAKIVRHQPMVDDELAGVALAFEQPIDLALEV